LGGVFFDEDDYCKAGEELFSITERFISRNGGADKPTFFELMTLYFFLCARTARCNVMVVETGMGGRLDATNIVDPLLSVITLIEKEHTEYLGNTLALIAGEKAGIIKQGHPVVLAEQKKEAYDVFRQRASEKSSRLYYLPDITRIQNIKISVTGTSFILDSGLLSMPLDLSVPTPGIVQAQNAALAVLAVNASFPDVEPEAVTRGLAKTALRSRFEKIRDDPVVIADGAHTDASVAACADTWTALYGKGGVLLFGCAADKNVPAIASILCPLFSRIIITAPGTFKVSFPEKIYAVFAEIAKIEGETAFLPAEKLQCIPETGLAIERALSLGRENELPVLVTGSFYLAGEISSLGNH
jgi:dihydrofolate synthase/folylpolyglutamate synthase